MYVPIPWLLYLWNLGEQKGKRLKVIILREGGKPQKEIFSGELHLNQSILATYFIRFWCKKSYMICTTQHSFFSKLHKH